MLKMQKAAKMQINVKTLLWVGDHNFTNVSENGFVATGASRASCELIFCASESCVRALSGACRLIL